MSLGRRELIVGGASMIVGSFALAPLVWPTGVSATDESEAPANETTQAAQVETVTVTRGDLTETVDRNGSVGFGSESTLPIEADGLVTETRESGDTVGPGEVLVRISNRPVTLAEGTQPLYRELRRVGAGERDVANDRIGLQTGPDVEQLQRFLLAAGFDDNGRLEADGTFGLTTERAVEDWQRDVGHPATGKVDRSQLVFVAGQVRIESAPAVGQLFSSVSVTSGSPKVTLTVSDAQRSFFAVGSNVELESLGSTATGQVTSQKRTVNEEGSTAYAIEIELAAGSDLGDAETAKVIATKTSAENVLSVPVRALVALAEGGWAVQVDASGGPMLTAVELGLVIDGRAEISGIDEGTELVVPV